MINPEDEKNILDNMLAKKAVRANFMSAQEDMQGDLEVTGQRTTFVDQLAEVSPNLGTISAGRFLALSAGSEPTDSDACGAFMSADGETFGSSTYNVGGVNNGTLQFGLSSTDGKALAGAGEVIIDADGISMLMPTTTYSDKASVKWTDGAETPIKVQAKKYIQLGITPDTNALGIDVTGNASVNMASIDLNATNGDASASAGLTVEAGNGAGTGRVIVGADSFLHGMNRVLTVADKFTLAGHGNLATVGAGATSYASFGYFGLNATAANVSCYASNISPKNVYLRTTTTQPATGSLVLSLQNVAGTTTYGTLTVAAGTGAGIHTITCSGTTPDNTALVVKIVNNASGASAQIAGISLEYTPG